MEQAHVSLAASSIVRICCDRFEEQDWSGRFYTMYREEPASFLNTRELLEGLDGFYNWLGYPQTSMAERNFLEPLEENEQASGRQSDLCCTDSIPPERKLAGPDNVGGEE